MLNLSAPSKRHQRINRHRSGAGIGIRLRRHSCAVLPLFALIIIVASNIEGFAADRPGPVRSQPAAGALAIRPDTGIEVLLGTEAGWQPELRWHLEGSLSGPCAGTATRAPETGALRVTPRSRFQPGEVVRLTVARGPGFPGLSLAFRTATRSSADGFQLGGRFPVGAAPNMLGASDLDSDGDVDLVISDVLGSDGIQVFLNDGLGRFTARDPVIVPELADPCRFSIADFDRDGWSDLVVAGESSANLFLLRGTGGGELEPSPPRELRSRTPVQTALGDLDLDGRVEVLIAHLGESEDITILEGGDEETEGVLSTERSLPVGRGVQSMVLTDLDRDGDLDLAVANEQANEVAVFRNSGNGEFERAGSWPAGKRPEAILEGDLNGDGWIDLVAINQGSNDLSIFLGRGDFTFEATATHAAGDRPFISALADLDGDGDLDLAVPGLFSDDVTLLTNRGDGTFEEGGSFAVDSGPVAVAAADLDGDGTLDLAVVSSVADNVTIWNNVESRPRSTAVAAPKNLGQNVPNPFNPATQIAYRLDSPGYVELEVFDTSGKIVRILVDGYQTAGSHVAPWDGTSEAGEKLPSGVYFYRLTTEDRVELRRMTLLR